MGKHSCWFGWLRSLFFYGKQSQITDNKKARKWRWFSVGRVKRIEEGKIEEATEKQRKYAVKVAIATAAAAEAAVAAAHAAAEIVRLTANPSHKYSSDRHLAAIQIQSAYRRHLGRKALVALKGVVKLQALIRGQTVRRRYMNTASVIHQLYPNHFGDFHSKLQFKSQGRWDYNILSKQDIHTLCSKRNDANLKRDRMMKYSFSHREKRNNLMMEPLPKRPETARQRQSQRLQQPLSNDAILNSSTPDIFGTLQVRTRSGRKQDSNEGLYSPVSCPRRSFCRTRCTNTVVEENFVPSSPVFPTYMAATESAKAKARSISTPRQIIGMQDFSSENKNPRFSVCASYNGDTFSNYGVDDVSQSSPYTYKLKSPFHV